MNLKTLKKNKIEMLKNNRKYSSISTIITRNNYQPNFLFNKLKIMSSF